MKEIKTVDALGHVLCHDITEIVKDEVKHPRFKKGHVVREEDIPVLLRLGKENLFVWEKEDGMVHEDEAVEYLADLSLNENMTRKGPSEGKVDGFAAIDGLFKVDIERLYKLNSYENMMIASRHNNTPVRKGDKLFGTRIIPLVIEEETMEKLKKDLGLEPIFQLKPYKLKKVGLVVTGSEVKNGLIKDTFGPVMESKVKDYGGELIYTAYPGDDKDLIGEEALRALEKGADLVLCTGGMSVDPDDKTPGAIKGISDTLVSYGAPVLPGAMFAMGYRDGKAIIGVPGCAMYSKRTILDLILPRLMAGEVVKREDIVKLGHGGLCLECQTCVYPDCGFGRGA